MIDGAAVDRRSEDRITMLRPVTSRAEDQSPAASRLAADLATALRAVRGYVPNHIWWDAGAADALLAYQATAEG